MKPTMIKNLALIFASVCIAGTAQAQTNSTELAAKRLNVTAQAMLRIEPNNPKLFLTVQLINNSDQEVTVLTKSLQVLIEPHQSPDSNGKRSFDQLGLKFGITGQVTYDGHLLIPSLCDFSPVTLRPNEAAYFSHEVKEVGNGLALLEKRSDLPLVVKYSVSPEWGKRFAVWSGSVETLPFTATLRK
jgi:hypothetical protein